MRSPLEKQETYDLSLLDQSLQKWLSSSGLRNVYQDIFKQLIQNAEGSRWLELGSGAGFFKQFDNRVVTSDIRKTSYVDQAVSAYEIHKRADKWDAIFAMDMLHHLTRPFDFFASAAQALAPSGRIILAEPCGTSLGRRFYKIFHQEPCEPALLQPPFEFEIDENGEFANMGMSESLFNRHARFTQDKLAQIGLAPKKAIYRDLLAYPLTGGLSKPQMLPTFAINALLAMEKWIPQSILKHLALRSIIVIEKQSSKT